MNKNWQIGKNGEAIVKKWYLDNDYKFIHSNFQYYSIGRGRKGEIDLIFKKDNILIFIEVKTRNNLKFGKAIEQIPYTKIKTLQNAANYFLTKYPEFKTHFCRFDAALIDNGKLQIMENIII